MKGSKANSEAYY